MVICWGQQEMLGGSTLEKYNECGALRLVGMVVMGQRLN